MKMTSIVPLKNEVNVFLWSTQNVKRKDLALSEKVQVIKELES